MNVNELLLVKQKVESVYRWLKWSPLFTVATLYFLLSTFGFRNASPHLAVFGSALWHLVILGYARDPHPFVRWHGRQGLLLAGVRTLLALWAVGASMDGDDALFFFFLLIGSWVFGNRWGRMQVEKIDCWLMRKGGQAAELEAFARAYHSADWKQVWVQEGLTSESDKTRTKAVIALGNLEQSDEEVVNALQQARLDDSFDVRDAARVALLKPVHRDFLAKMKEPGRVSSLRVEPVSSPEEAYQEGVNQLEAGARKAAVAKFATAFRDGRAEVRKRAMEQLEILEEIEVF